MRGQTPSLLVLDDEEMIRESLQMYLESKGWRVKSAGSAEEALQQLSQETFDIAIVDIRLPGMSGRDFILKAHGVQTDLRFLVYTGSAAFGIDAALEQAGMRAENILAKPLEDLQMLADAAQRLLA